MCGIIGWANRSGDTGSISWLEQGLHSMHHRGPDGSGIWISDDHKTVFGHNRLSIIDLSLEGNQPMVNGDGDLCITFNGEIYNYLDLKKELVGAGYSFRSNSDTEVLLAGYHAWGTGILNKVNGMFAFAIWNKAHQKIFIARDRAGEKPLFYFQNDREILFASELKGLFAYNDRFNRIDIDSFNEFLAEGYVPSERSIIMGVKKLPPAHAIEYDLATGECKKWRYWQLPEYQEPAGINTGIDALAEELEGLLANSVRRQLVADVPVGVLLSGGLDSSLVTAMAARAAKKVKTFTVSFPGHKKYNEAPHARLIADHFGTEHTELVAEPTSLALLSKLAGQYDEPIMDSSMIPTFLVSEQIRQHCTVALGGDGGDELFGGYSHYDKLLQLKNRTKHIPHFLKRAMAFVSDRYLATGYKGRSWLQALSTDLNNGLPLIASYFSSPDRHKLLSDEAYRETESSRMARVPLANNLLDRAMRMDYYNYLPEDILVKVDRASMLCSLEVRAPMLDYRIIEFAFSKVPTDFKATAERKKILLKKVAATVLPPSFDQQRKQGFSIPIADWLSKKEWQDFFREVLFDRGQDIFNKKYITQMLDKQQHGYANGERLFGLVQFELWRKQYCVRF